MNTGYGFVIIILIIKWSKCWFVNIIHLFKVGAVLYKKDKYGYILCNNWNILYNAVFEKIWCNPVRQ